MGRTGSIKSNIGKHLEEYNLGTHLCSIYSTPQEQLTVIVPYIKIGLSRNEQCVYILDEGAWEDIAFALEAAGVDVEGEMRSDALVIVPRRQVSPKSISPSASVMIDFLRGAVKNAKIKGFKGLRVLAEMSWIQDGAVSSESLIEFESKLDRFFEQNDASLICQYNRSRVPSEIIEEMIYIHPFIIFADMICKNSYYIPPEQYLSSDSADHRVNQLLISMSVSEYRRQRGNN